MDNIKILTVEECEERLWKVEAYIKLLDRLPTMDQLKSEADELRWLLGKPAIGEIT